MLSNITANPVRAHARVSGKASLAAGLLAAGLLAASLSGCAGGAQEGAEASDAQAYEAVQQVVLEPAADLADGAAADEADVVSVPQSDAQIASLSAYASYESSKAPDSGLTGLNALAVDTMVEMLSGGYDDDPYVRIATGGFYVPASSRTPLVDQAAQAMGVDSSEILDSVDESAEAARLATGSALYEPTSDESSAAALGYPVLLCGWVGFPADADVSSPGDGAYVIANAVGGYSIDVTDQVYDVLGGAYASADEYAAAVTEDDLALAYGDLSAEDFANAVWACLRTDALDYDAVNAALDGYWGVKA